MLGERVAGKYQLRKLLGSGAMGAVYEGVHLDIGKRLAIKLIHPEYCESPEVVARFRREARAASAVDSDYIVQIYDFGRDDKLGLYMVIEYLEGEDLETRLGRERWIGERETAAIGIQMGRGLAKAHTAGIVHRDLKPANIFLTKNEDGSTHVKLLDFGISKFDPDASPTSLVEPTLTAHGVTLGTPEYMSPEQIKGLPDVDARADVWAMAAVLYEMLAGEPAVNIPGSHMLIMQHILDKDIMPLAERASWVSAPLAAVVDAGLVRDRSKRIPDAASFVMRLLEAFPDAGSRPSLTQAIVHTTDVSELRPPESEAVPSTTSDPRQAVAAMKLPVSDPSLRAAAGPSIRDTGNPASAQPPSSQGPVSSTEDGIEIFERGGMLPKEIAELRAKKVRK
jgi:eukaryotic-like serine/threonine-protein kinase